MPSSLAFGVPLLKSTNEYELSESSSPYFFGVLEVVESGLELLLEELAFIAGRKSCHGTATCFPLKDELLESPELVPAVVDKLEDEPVLDEVPVLVPPAALEPPAAPVELLSEMMAKSMRPPIGFTI